jgi:signal transduction histidine kinase
MRKFFLFFYLCFFFTGNAAFAQSLTYDSTWFADYYLRLRTLRSNMSPATYDSLPIIRPLAEKEKTGFAFCRYHIEKGCELITRQKNKEAIDTLTKAIELARQSGHDIERGSAYLHLANLYQFNGNTIAAAENYLPAAALLKSTGNKRVLIGLYRNLYSILNKLEQKNSTLQNTRAAVVTDKRNKNDLIQLINQQTSEESGLSFPDQTLIREGGTDGIYVIFGNAKFPVNTLEILGSYGSVRDIHRVPPGTVSRIPDFPRNGSIMRELTDRFIYLAKDGELHQINSFDILEYYGGWDAVYFVPPGTIKKFTISAQPVTLETMSTVFNLGQEFDILTDSIHAALQKNRELSNELSSIVAVKNSQEQRRRAFLWASAIGVAALLIIVLLLVRNFRQKQRLNKQSIQALKKQEELERKTAIEKERTRIATDMHDDLGAGLSRIKFLSETIGIKKQQQVPIEEDISKIREYSHEMIDKMGEIVWALNEKNDSVNDLLSYTRSYAVEYLSQNGINCVVNMPDPSQEYFLSGEWRRNIYLSVKEALHNIVKHARARQVTIDIRTSSLLEIIITDDGVGFAEQVKPFRNGLTNMRSRMEAIGGNFDIANEQGTRVTLRAPLSA